MVRSLLCIMLVWPMLSVAAPVLDLKFDKTETELGVPFIVQLTGTGFKKKLSDISLQALNQDFGVQPLEYTSTKQDSGQKEIYTQIYTLKLYPRQTGMITVPSLSFADSNSKQKNVSVTAADAGVAPVTIESSISSTTIWTREQVLVTTSVTTPDLFASLESPKPQIDSYEVIPIEETRTRIKKDGQSYVVLRIGWVLFPLGSGQQNISLPPIRYKLDGIIQRVFYLPVQKIDIRKLSPYVPPILPVGKVIVESEIQGDSPLNTDTLYYWNVTLHGDGITPWSLPPVLRQIKSSDHIQFFPAVSTRETNTNLTGLHGKVMHRIPFKVLTSGSLALPDLRVQYFEPNSGRIVTIKYQPEKQFVLGMSWRLIIGLVIVLLAYQAGMYLYHRWVQFRDRYQLRKAALQSIEKSSNAHELRTSLKLIAKSEGWHKNLSITQWAQCWKSKYISGNDADHLATNLSNTCYGKSDSFNLEEFKLLLTRLISNRHRLDKRVTHVKQKDPWLPENFSCLK